MDNLSDERSHCATGLNDWAFRAERSTGADGNRRGDRLQYGNSGLNTAAIYQDRFHGFGDAVSFDLWAAIFGHDPDNQAADDRDHDHPRTERMRTRADELR